MEVEYGDWESSETIIGSVKGNSDRICAVCVEIQSSGGCHAQVTG